MISEELFGIILSELSIREGSTFALKIQARAYDGRYAHSKNDFGKSEHQRLTKLKHTFALDQSKEQKKSTIADLANRMLNAAKNK